MLAKARPLAHAAGSFETEECRVSCSRLRVHVQVRRFAPISASISTCLNMPLFPEDDSLSSAVMAVVAADFLFWSEVSVLT